ncbi:Nucleotide-binding universal stress protein, UspA family [Halogranum rubrum]|uniref:Nucleotide-binding universal stress protein, UspA family n=1 Tax=Halogranum rubrum TaxID=553466 RepID=A0A1I4F8Q5_9EURY|nr:universal stress protein [Halogranum rubrum]SFL14348.1 Nucleotide-binding universal stress protein, UspA family [Halogranum rubrum]
MYDEILLPSDGSPAATGALDHALDLAATYGSRLHVLYVVDQSAVDSIVSESELVAVALEGEGTEAVDAIERRAAERGVDVVTDVLTGHPARTILDYATGHDIDLLVMGTNGRTGLDRYLLGSVTERVVRNADVPVLVVRRPEASEAPEAPEASESSTVSETSTYEMVE